MNLLTNDEINAAYIEAANQTLRPQDERIALGFARAIIAATVAKLAAGVSVEPNYLCKSTRFKMSFFENEDGQGGYVDGTHVTCFESFEDELDGKWVALVPAENDRHIADFAAAIAAARVQALEEAAKECDRTASDYKGMFAEDESLYIAATDCANEIRALIGANHGRV